MIIILKKGYGIALCQDVSPSSIALKKQAEIMKIARPSASHKYNFQAILNALNICEVFYNLRMILHCVLRASFGPARRWRWFFVLQKIWRRRNTKNTKNQMNTKRHY
jgi:hypothetical protein